MHSWASNAQSLNEIFNESYSVNLKSNEKVERVLGLHWVTNFDYLVFHFSSLKFAGKIHSNSKPTKRQFLSILMSIYDPLGFITPFTIQGRILMQEVWVSGIGWDDYLNKNELENWNK